MYYIHPSFYLYSLQRFVLGFPRETEPTGCVHTEKEIYCKERAHGTGGQQAPHLQGGLAVWRPQRAVVRRKSKGVCWRILSCWRARHFVLLRPPTEWVRSTHITEENLFTSKSLIEKLISPKTPKLPTELNSLCSWHSDFPSLLLTSLPFCLGNFL